MAPVTAQGTTQGTTRNSQPGIRQDYWETRQVGDVVEMSLTNGITYRIGRRELRADAAVITFDRDEYRRATAPAAVSTGRPPAGDPSGAHPRRGMSLPDDRRVLSPALLLRRFDQFLQSLGRSPTESTPEQRAWISLIRSVYVEGNIVVLDGGVEVLRASNVMFSVPDNRAVLENVTLRLITRSRDGFERQMILRAPKLEKLGSRTSGRKVSMTTCTAGEPHFAIGSGQVEIIERGDEFEVRTRDNELVFSGRHSVPLPDTRFFTKEQSQVPIKGVSGNYSQLGGFSGTIDLGSSFNETGGALHEFLFGRPAHEFRGDWRLGLTASETRGNPIDGEVRFRAGDLYQGQMLGLYQTNDTGKNRYAIRNYIDGVPITQREREMFQTETRVNFGDGWRMDLTAFSSNDPSLLPEFYLSQLHNHELPETSLYLRHAEDNHLFTVTGRTNLNTFSYGDDRALETGFREEAPLVTYDVFSEPLLSLGEVDLLLTSSTSAGWLRHEFDSRYAMPVQDRTFRFDQEVELAAPFHVGPFAVRPRSSARFTHYDNSVAGLTRNRWAFDAGISATTRLARTFHGTNADGSQWHAQHTMYPSISFGHSFQVDQNPELLYQFDEVDALNEKGVVRVGLLNRVQTKSSTEAPRRVGVIRENSPRRGDWLDPVNVKTAQSQEVLWVDVAQNFFPTADRDNQGHPLGLFEYEVILRPRDPWSPVPGLKVLLEGEHDWNTGRARTLNTELRFGKVIGMDWMAGYRADSAMSGTLRYGAGTQLFGRFALIGMGAYDLQSHKQLNYLAQVIRRDHDWVLRLAMTYDILSDNLSFTVNFEPLFGGLFRSRAADFAGMRGEGVDALLER
ncbi:MAG: hypothetical protein KDC87_11805 [Planctomycetes bacterium]|nr:hypothetical protein [Planctomycetota bacterium]MCB9870250.1 hypothetical protein [Planctomycetota bacterium]MCB9888169.1 hypothetical protein [Planctomycetota bacterium]